MKGGLTIWACSAILCVFTLLVGWLVAERGFAVGLVDAPSSRSSHTEKTPRAGGVGVVVAALVAAVILRIPARMWAPAAGIGLLGLVDDRWHVDPRLRLLIQCLLAAASVGQMMAQSRLPIVWGIAASILLTLIVVGTTNVFNFMDGSNGMAGLMGVVVFSTIAALSSILARNAEISDVAIIIAAGCCGFLTLNLRVKARVFMGDVCSTFLGFTAAVLALRLGMQRPLWGLVALGAMTAFYVDAGLTILVRLRRHEHLFEAHRSHAYQRLVNELGWAHPTVAVLYAGIQLVVSTLLLLSLRGGYGAVVGVLASSLIALSVLYQRVQKKALGGT